MLLLTLTLGWKIFFAVTILSFIGTVSIFIAGCMDADGPPNWTIINYDDLDFESDEMFQENDMDEFSPENQIDDFDRTLRILKLKNKLNKIEEERHLKDDK